MAESGCGLTVPPEAPAAVARAAQLAALSAQERQAMGERGQNFVRARHSYAVLAQRFLQAMA